MGSQALLDMMGKEPTAFVAVDTIGGRKGLGKRMLEVCGNDHVLPEGWTDGMAVDERKLHRLSDARNFPESGVLLTDELVLEVPMHTEEDTVEDVDWAFVAAAAKKLAELI